MRTSRRHINPDRDISDLLSRVDTPARYLGGERGRTVKDNDTLYTVALCFPDLYEIGMSNTAIKILYTLMNRLDEVRCERVFAPALDFEEALRQAGVPLYTLESGIPLCECDMIAFSVGYELSATNVLAVLESGGVSLDRATRSDSDPIVIAGGPALTNPTPYGQFLDAVIVGEAEGCLPELLEQIAKLKKAGASKAEILDAMLERSFVWNEDKNRVVTRSLWPDFGKLAFRIDFPLPHLRPVQDHGVIEIMRGCPNGCRFCHAGVYYRPYRMKDVPAIIEEADRLVFDYGYRDITLSSLSSGDYREIAPLMKLLHARYRGMNVAFSLPSLKVDSFTLPILEQLSEVRKSGLTFAVETPWDEAQVALNKRVSSAQIIEILKEAKSRGFRSAKFYFMIGLPVEHAEVNAEMEGIVEFVRNVFGATGIHVNLNVGIFVPKPHTPYQWARQMSEVESIDRIRAIRAALRRYGFVKMGFSSPFHSFIEGIISRGDARAGTLIRNAYHGGARFDAWEDRTKHDAWRSAIEGARWNVAEETLRSRSVDEKLPWDNVSLGVSKSILIREWTRSVHAEPTTICAPECQEPCGVCNRRTTPREPTAFTELVSDSTQNNTPAEVRPAFPEQSRSQTDPMISEEQAVESAAGDIGSVSVGRTDSYRLYFEFSKRGPARFLPHRSVLTGFERAFQAAHASVLFGSGYSPKPAMELSSPLPLGAEGLAEIGRVDIAKRIHIETLPQVLSRLLPEGLVVNRVALTTTHDDGRRRPTIGGRLWGGRYVLVLPPGCDAEEVVNAFSGEAGYTVARVEELEAGRTRFELLCEAIPGVPGVAAMIKKLLGSTVAESGASLTREELYARDDAGGRTAFF